MARALTTYIRSDSFIHRLHPITKLVIITGVGSAALAVIDPRVQAALFVLALVLFAASRLPISILRSIFVLFIPLAIVIWLVYLFASSLGGPVFYRIVGVQITIRGVTYALGVTIRFLTLIITTAVLFTTTQQTDIVLALRQLRFHLHSLNQI